ncbi:hypothetical protein SODALDRAFT_33948 [Sodiomyces alkalinus F11]|uniref:ABM domain-containing protein n=1 Tax=Sodiomyces alkalinus (strain CBS 110278 / VKM F-3762 / F11) TaxID=1314773 RepID=A0A3N2Q9B4_SODAK|nr:hypothetical protein SODALDRAFT_33948 [Sodiomyces alkalinus F11]ROT43225.1 hypothetical protein SODALDRAFT_33948 [Sodiomyces alkalinus F11]
MAVTEFTALPIKGTEVSAEFKAALEEGQTVQDKYVLGLDPSLPADRTARGTGIFQQVEDPSNILLVSQWPSVEKHFEWAGTPDNQGVQAKTAEFFNITDPKQVSNIHVDAEIFTKVNADQKTAISAPILSVGRLGIPADKKADFQAAFDRVRPVVEAVSGTYPLQGGWKIENGGDEFIIAGGWDSIEQHGSIASNPNWKELEAFVTSWNFAHYKRVL